MTDDYRVYSESGEFLLVGKAENGKLKTIKSFFEVSHDKTESNGARIF